MKTTTMKLNVRWDPEQYTEEEVINLLSGLWDNAISTPFVVPEGIEPDGYFDAVKDEFPDDTA